MLNFANAEQPFVAEEETGLAQAITGEPMTTGTGSTN